MLSNVAICVNAVLPLLLTMMLGFIARASGLAANETISKMNSVVFKLMLPFLVFDNIYRSDIHSAVDVTLIVYTVACTVAFFALGVLCTRRLVPDERRRVVAIQCFFRTNIALVGLPVARNIYGDGNIGCVAVLMAFVVPLFNLLAVITLESFSGKKVSLPEMVLKVLKNPMIIGSLAGFAFLLCGWRLPKAAETFVTDMRNASAAMLLFLLGASFRFGGLRKNIKLVSILSAIRLVVVPTAILAGGVLLGFRDVAFVALLGAVTSPLPTNAFTMTKEMGGDGELAGNVVVMSSVLSLITVFGWCLLFKTLGIF